MIRTSKQHLGLQDCFSKSLQTQHSHVASVLLSYALTQLDMKKYRLKTPEQSIERSKTKNVTPIFERFARLGQNLRWGNA